MQDSNVRVTYRRNPNFCERIGSSLMGVVIGLVVICVACYLLFWNEGRAVHTAQSLDEGINSVVSLGTSATVDTKHNGVLVHLSGQLRTNKVLSDKRYGVTVSAVRLKRSVEMYQWVEEEHKREYNEGDQTRVETTYTYTQNWKSHLINSASFDSPHNHMNPGSFPIDSVTQECRDVQVGNFILSPSLVSQINNYQVFTPDIHQQNLQQADGWFYHQGNIMHPQVGDLRVKFEVAGLTERYPGLGPPDTVSVIAGQDNNYLRGFQTQVGLELEILYLGSYSAQEMFQREQNQNTMLTWLLRFVGWLLCFIGFGFLTSIVTTLVDWIPIVRELVGMGVFLMNASLAISLSLTVIALGWIRYRPLLGLTILACSLIPFIIPARRSSSSRERRD